MKARIKATGEIVNILIEDADFVGADNGYLYKYNELDFNLNYESKKERLK